MLGNAVLKQTAPLMANVVGFCVIWATSFLINGAFRTKKIPNIYARQVPVKKLIDATITVVGRNVQPIMDLYKFDVV